MRFVPCAALVLTLAIIYVATLLPGVGYSGDTAKFQFVGRVLGTPHATGYPTYVMLLHVFQRLIPFGTLAYRANLLSAVFAVLACVFLFAALRQIDVPRAAALAGALTACLARTFWSQALVAEVYALHELFLAGTLYFLFRWRRTRARGDFLAASAVYAFSFGNHMTAITLLPGFAAFVSFEDRAVYRDRSIMLCVLLIIGMAASQYAFLTWRSRDPGTPYLESRAPDLGSLLHVVSGGQLRGQFFAFSPGRFLVERVPLFVHHLFRELGAALPFAGLGLALPGDRPLRVLFILAILAPLLFALEYDIGDIKPYFIPAYTLFALCFALGVARIQEWGRWRGARYAGVAALLVPAWSVGMNFHHLDRSRDAGVARAATAILDAAGRDAVILSPDYATSEFLWHYLLGEGRERKRLYVDHHVNADGVRAYLTEGRPIALPEEQKEAGPRLAVYTVSGAYRRELEAAGLRLSPATPPLDRVRPR